jgi:hypothetical protein
MSEQNTFVASDETVGRNRKPNRKEPKQISFRVSESEYLKLKQSAETLNMSVPAFVKKKGTRRPIGRTQIGSNNATIGSERFEYVGRKCQSDCEILQPTST